MNLNASEQQHKSPLPHLNRYLPEEIRVHIEQTYYAKVEQQAKLDYAINDQDFLANPAEHVALYSDHGVVHVRDVAQNIIKVLDNIYGILIPAWDELELEILKAYGVMLAYIHDIGMRDFSAFGRAMHPEFAAQAVFSPAFDEIVDLIWTDNYGNMGWALTNLHKREVLQQEPKLVLRELLAMAVGHSKSKVPIEVLNDPAKLRSVMMQSISVELHHLYHEQRLSKAERKLKQARQQTQPQTLLDELSATLNAAQADQAQFLNSPTGPERDNQHLKL